MPRLARWALPALLLPAAVMAQEETGWRVECAPTSTIVEGKMTPASACAATLAGNAALRLWTAARSAEGRDVRAPSVTIDFAVPADRVAILGSRFTANAPVLAAQATYRFDFADAPAVEGKCDRLIVPPRRAAPADGGPRPRDFDRIGCQVEDPAAFLRGSLEAAGGVTASVTVAGIRLSAAIALPEGAADAYASAEARLSGAPAATGEEAATAAPSTDVEIDIEVEDPSFKPMPGR